MVNGDHDHREQLELYVDSMQASNILTAGLLTSRPQSRWDRSFIIGAGVVNSVGSEVAR